MMRLLNYSDDRKLNIDSFDDNASPPYAILSHTWGEDGDEVTFTDLIEGKGKAKPGYRKIDFCGQQVGRDNLQYFWIDTCCINKANKAEHSHAINSMFRWYQNAARCYVYLSDVPTAKGEGSPPLWDADFRNSRWFTRGWTLQELLAPATVEFFAYDRTRLGDKASLRQQIHEITGISDAVLQGAPLVRLDEEEIFSWNVHRNTKLKEDKVYSLLGIFEVNLSPFYGEGASKARDRLKDQINSRKQCIRDLCDTDPRHDKKRIEETKGGLLADAYHWVLENATFQQWQQDPHSRLLWVKGDPGKGKTMLLCGIINELQKIVSKTTTLSYFFCQATDSRINTATAVLRGLLYMLVSQQPLLVSHVRKKYDETGTNMFNDANAWVALTETFTDVLRDPRLRTAYILIDALDECAVDLLKLLDFVVENSSTSSRVKWIVSSRNWPHIEERLERAGNKVRLSLEINAASVAMAVSIFITQKVRRLAEWNKYDKQIQDAVLNYLLSNANDTFLWVALVCQGLAETKKRHVLKKLDLFPPGLDSLYKRMIQQIGKSDDAEVCKQVLASVALVYRPVTLQELAAVVEPLDGVIDGEVQEIVGHCGSFLTLREDTVYFVHQSAKEFILDSTAQLFPFKKEEIHYCLFGRSLRVLSTSLQRDMCRVKDPGYFIDEAEQPASDPLAVIRYSCINWVDHLLDAQLSSSATYAEDLQDGGTVDVFIREKFLYWLEGLSICKSMSIGLVSLAKLQLIVQEREQAAQLNKLLYDATRFAKYHKVAIECSPLQTYMSGLLFSPTNSLIRQLFRYEEPKGVIIKPAMQESWSTCLQTLEDHSGWVRSVAFSHDSTRLASGSNDTTVKIWDASSGTCLQTLEGHSDCVWSVAFLLDSTRLASGSSDKTVKIWDTSSGTCLQTLEGHNDSVRSVAFSPDSTRLASGSNDKIVKIWDASSGICLQTLEGHNDSVNAVTFSPDSTRLASASWDKIVKIWDASSGTCLQTLKGHSGWVNSVTFSPDSTRLASGSNDKTVKIWDASSGTYLQTLEGHSRSVWSVAFSPDSTRLASGSIDTTVKIWYVCSGMCVQTLEGHSGLVNSVTFSPDSTRLASGSNDKTVKIWDASSGTYLQTLEAHSSSVRSVAFSHDSTRLASASDYHTVKIWDAISGTCLQTLEGNSRSVRSVAFDSTWLASASDDHTVKIWDASSGTCLQTLEDRIDSHLVSILASLHSYKVVKTSQQPIYQGISVSADRTWIYNNSQKLLWLPTEYRPLCIAVSGRYVGLGTGSGKVWMCRLE